MTSHHGASNHVITVPLLSFPKVASFHHAMKIGAVIGTLGGAARGASAALAGCQAGFYNEGHAIDYARTVQDGMNFILVYNNVGETIFTIAPGNK